MKRNTWIVVGIVVVAVGLALLLSPLATFTRDSGTQSFSGVTIIEFDLENSPIELRVGGEEVIVEYSYSSGLFGSAGVNLDQSGETVRLEQDCPGFFIAWGCQASFEVTVPAGIEVLGATSNGAVSVSGVEGPIDVTTSNGAITFEDVTAPVVARTSNGAISGEGISSDDFDVATSNGRITLSFVLAPTSVLARSSNGTIEVLLPPDAEPFAVETSTSNGQVTTDIRIDPAAPRAMSLQTSNGDITVGYDS
jgi:Putative adhesin